MTEISQDMPEKRLKWLGHVMRRKEEYLAKSDGDGGAREEKERKSEAATSTTRWELMWMKKKEIMS